MNYGLGRIEIVDDRDKNFPVSAVLTEAKVGLPDFPSRSWWADGWWGNQGSTSMCVAFSWMHFLEDGPVIQDGVEHNKPFYNPKEFYDLCQLHDQWPGECVDTDTECLTKKGWTRYTDLEIGDELYTMNLDTQEAEWATVTKVNVFDDRDLISFSNSNWEIQVTENHKWVVRNRINKTPYKLVETSEINTAHQFPTYAPYSNIPTTEVFTTAFVKLIAWVATEGHIRKTSNTKRRGNGIVVSQQKYSDHLQTILLENNINNGTFRGDLFICEFSGDIASDVRRVISEDKIIDTNFILSLTKPQLQVFINECILGDGSIVKQDNRRSRKLFHQNVNNGNVLDIFIMACVLNGMSIGRYKVNKYFNNSTNQYEYTESWGIQTKEATDVRKMERVNIGKDKVWCPSTKNGTFLARRDGNVFFTGNSYDGTSIRAGAKILNKVGVIKSYRWAFTVEEVVKTVKYIGPMVIGTRWYANMTDPNNKNIMRPSGSSHGGHAYVINGCDDTTGLLRVKNSWGRTWGDNGYAYISYDDFATLLTQGGEACIAFENKMHTVPELLLG